MNEATAHAWRAEPRSKVAFDIEDAGQGVIKLTVAHEGFEPGSDVLQGISNGWPAVLASLKTLLENRVSVALDVADWPGRDPWKPPSDRTRPPLAAPQPSQGRAGGDDGRPRLYGGPMASVKQIQVTFDCAEPERVARFWCEVLGYVVPPPPEGFATWDDVDRALPPEHQGSAFACIDPSGAGPRLFFQRVPEGKVVKNRLHLDVRAGTGLVGEERVAVLEAECARLVALGAVRVRLLRADGDNESCLVMQDIEGNEFCLD